ncbi:MAG: hypothetical protein ABW143_03970 [Acidimicrobiales bacterium]
MRIGLTGGGATVDKVVAQAAQAEAAGATDIWAAVFPVGTDPRTSIRRTTDLLRELVNL